MEFYAKSEKKVPASSQKKNVLRTGPDTVEMVTSGASGSKRSSLGGFIIISPASRRVKGTIPRVCVPGCRLHAGEQLVVYITRERKKGLRGNNK